MIEITNKSIKNWSIVGPRPTLGLVLFEIAKSLENLMVVTADVSTSAGLDRFRKTFPEKFVDTGISEQNMIGIAAGLADNGYKVFTTTFAPFQTLRCLDQIKVDLAYSEIGVTMVGLASGLIQGPLGNTHCCIEDIGVLRSIPNIIILSPADGLGIAKSLIASLQTEKPVYIRLTGGSNHPVVYQNDVDYTIGKFNQLLEGEGISIIATGTMVYNSLKAAELLKQKGISVSVYDAHTIKPLDEEIVKKCATKDRLIVTVEEHNVYGGLGSSVAECIVKDKNSTIHLALGVNDVFLHPGDYNFMLKQAGLLPEQIAESILMANSTI
jgi:transketolase